MSSLNSLDKLHPKWGWHWVFVLLAMTALSCSDRTESLNLNEVAFRDAEARAVDSLKVLVGILNSAYESAGLTDYAIEHDGSVVAEWKRYPTLLHMMSDSLGWMGKHSPEKRDRLARLMLFLKYNHMPAAAWSDSVKAWYFLYDTGYIERSDDDRFIFLSDNESVSKRISGQMQLVQLKGQLLLVARKNARASK